MKSNPQVQAAAEGMPEIATKPVTPDALNDLSLKVSDATGFARVLQHLVDDLFASGRLARRDVRTGCLMVETHEADMLIFMANQTKWAVEACDTSFEELGH